MNLHQNSKIFLFLGGSQSGKSLFAENCARKWNRVIYYATGGQIENSPEWDLRIQKHKERRPEHWTTIEYPIGIEEIVKLCDDNDTEILLIDCLTLWIGWQIAKNVNSYSQVQLLKHIELEYQYFIKELLKLKCPAFVVSNEVGEGVIPGTDSGRIFREALGNMNTAIAEIAQCISFSISGQHLLLKSNLQQYKNGFYQSGLINEDYIYSEIIRQ